MSEETTTSELNFQKISAYLLLVVVVCVAFVGVLVGVARSAAHPETSPDPEAVNSRIAPVAQIALASATPAAAGGRSGEHIYKASCAACHDTGAAGAPKVGDNGAWTARLKLGLDGLVKSATQGKNAMPPKGGSDANESELARTIVYMANKSGGSLKEPAAK